MTDDQKWEVAMKASGMTQANIVRGRLATEGIPVLFQYDAAGTIYAITIDGLGEVRILVPADLLDRARSVLSQSYDERDMDWETFESS